MKNFFLTLLLLVTSLNFLFAETKVNEAVADNPFLSSAAATAVDDITNYRRSSLCIILVTHQGTKYATDMERQFLKMKLPERYNEHNVQIRVLHTDKSLKEKDIVSLLQRNQIGKQLVAKWFNRNPYTGYMNMKLIHDRGGYNASMSDAERADMTVRGRAILQEEGVDLIQNTYVLVCDMEYKKRDDAGVWAMLGTSLLSAGLGAYGRTAGVDLSKTTQQLDQTAVELADLSGFSVIMDAHLLQLNWTPNDLDRLYSNYWVDKSTPSAEAVSHKNAFDNANNAFNLSYLGHYRSRSTTIQMESTDGFDDVILEVTDRTVNKSIKELALMFPQFKPKTPLVHNANGLMAYVGTKEDVTYKTKFDVVEPVKESGQIKYNKVGVLNVMPGYIWDNRNVRLDEISDLSSVQGTLLYSKGRKDYTDQPYMLIESGKSKYTGLKKFTFDVGFRLGTMSLPEEEVQKKIAKSNLTSNRTVNSIDASGFVFTLLDLGWTWNISKAVSWNILQGKMGLGAFGDFGVGTGVTVRFATLSKKSNTSLFLQPTVGFGYLIPMENIKYSYTSTKSTRVKYTTQEYSPITKKWRTVTKYRYDYSTTSGEDDVRVDSFTYLDWGIRLGINYRKFFFSLGYGANEFMGAHVGWHL